MYNLRLERTLHYGYSLPLTNLATQTEFSQPEKIVAADQRIAMVCNLKGGLFNY